MAKPIKAYTAESVDGILEKFEKCAERQNANKGSMVKLRAAERDLLAAAEVARDLLIVAVKGDKEKLAQVFGGSCQRFHRFKNVLSEVELSDMHKADQRWPMLADAIETIEEVLRQLGQFKPWKVGAQPPDSIHYAGGTEKRYSPGEKVKWDCIVDGADATSFSVEPELPEGVVLNSSTGTIMGTFRPDLEVEEKTYVITASNGAGSTTTELTFAVQVPPPESISYSGFPDKLFIGEAVAFEAKVGGAARQFSVQPELPKGLEVDGQLGTILGTPMEKAPETAYELIASNPSGQASTTVKFSVKDAPPIGLVYSGLQPTYPVGAVVYLVPKVRTKGSTAAVTVDETALKKLRRATQAMRRDSSGVPGMLFSVEPPLPEGLTLTATGIITGTPTTPQEEQTYKVKVENESGHFELEFPFGVKLSPPSNLTYADTEERRVAEDGVAYTYAEFSEWCAEEDPSGKLAEEGWAVSEKKPIQDAYYTRHPISLGPTCEGTVREWSVDPALPSGMSLDAGMGFISGIPTEKVEKGSWTVTAKNEEGETTFVLSFEIHRAAPSKLSYPAVPDVFPLLRQVREQPSAEGDVEEFSVSPTLPEGLSLDSKTGAIHGTPTAVADEAEYEITAKNETGATSVTVKFAVRVMPPEGLSYPSVDDVYGVGEEVSLEPSVEGGATTWTAEPDLPQGLAMDGSTGKISGVPKETSPETSYVITASNDAGGTSAVLSFAITAPAPEGLGYPRAADDYIIKEPMSIEPTVEKGLCMTFSVEPALPGGLKIDPKTGIISGAPEAASAKKTYKVTAANSSGSSSVDVSFSCSEPPEVEAETVDQRFAAMVEEITDIAMMVAEPKKSKSLGNWMIWMVHRAWLNDPTLTDFNFTGLRMPLPHVEPRIAPKLMKAMEWNCHITSLQLANSNMMKPQGHELANSLKNNVTLKVLNIESNLLDSESVRVMAEAIKENKDCALEQWRLASQLHLGQYYGRPVEQAVAELVQAYHKIVKLGFACQDPHWNDKINRAILRNVDEARRARKGQSAPQDEVKAVDKQLGKLTLEKAPTTKAVWEVFDDDDVKLKTARLCVAETKKFPTNQQLQAYARKVGNSLPYSAVAPLIKDFRAKLLGSVVGTEVVVVDPFGANAQGILRGWTEKNDRMNLDIWTSESARFNYTSTALPTVEVSDDFAEWLKPN